MAEKQPQDETVFDNDTDLDALVAEMEAAKAPAADVPPPTDAQSVSDDLEMVEFTEVEEPPAAPATGPVTTETAETAEVELLDDDVEMVSVDEEPETAAEPPAPSEPLPAWLGDDLPDKPLVERDGLSVDLADTGTPVELDLRHEFERETPPDPEYTEKEAEEAHNDEEPKFTVCGKCGTRNDFTLKVCRNCGDLLRHAEEDDYLQ